MEFGRPPENTHLTRCARGRISQIQMNPATINQNTFSKKTKTINHLIHENSRTEPTLADPLAERE